MPVSFKDLDMAYEFVSSSGFGAHEAWLCKPSGKIYWHADSLDHLEQLPEDLDDHDKYVAIPDKRALDLGKPLMLDFARRFLPDDAAEVRDLVDRRGAYALFKALLQRRSALERWYDFETKAEEAALRAWCKDHGIEVI